MLRLVFYTCLVLRLFNFVAAPSFETDRTRMFLDFSLIFDKNALTRYSSYF